MQALASQLSLWDEPEPIRWHQHMELHFYDGSREIVCCEAPTRKYRKDNSYAGYIGQPLRPDECHICNAKKKEANK